MSQIAIIICKTVRGQILILRFDDHKKPFTLKVWAYKFDQQKGFKAKIIKQTTHLGVKIRFSMLDHKTMITLSFLQRSVKLSSCETIFQITMNHQKPEGTINHQKSEVSSLLSASSLLGVTEHSIGKTIITGGSPVQKSSRTF